MLEYSFGLLFKLIPLLFFKYINHFVVGGQTTDSDEHSNI